MKRLLIATDKSLLVLFFRKELLPAFVAGPGLRYEAMLRKRPLPVALAGIFIALLALGVAIGSERFLDLIPCALCLRERWPYRLAIVFGVAACLVPPRAARAACWLMVLTFVVAGAAGFVHVGVEQHWWKSPLPECAVPDLSGLTPAQRFARMPATPSKPCEDPDYLIPGVPVTMPQMNVAYALAAAAGLAMWLRRIPERRR